MVDTNDALIAAVDLVGRSGAKEFQFGYLHDDVPTEEAGWYAHAAYQGARITAENHVGPVEAVEALAQQVLTGAQCKCGRLVALSDEGAVAFTDTMLANGKRWTAEMARAAGQCRWRRQGRRWEPGCRPAPAGAAFMRQ